ncbi:ArnT family glycosyltransferase [Thalassoglobus polymorphus]|uniref:Undecaprenyl phosphate-alpha-4-amino-4-deoxy-L-arabinose arabinosyl transferase n=1 Tax=Thalassoglobus polymorphus TaxID=2527994 RepID=A0A517QPY6_9PLAN|nr:glycosyltransferase family 39 protein [Thalassoglobus polymorphus]QDT33667.1 Undecaprenyl phosphate-alpha-4-amino-4-deoxy-L-arabinose arabinosyl transferase [Thalassoglobus polymorphus]
MKSACHSQYDRRLLLLILLVALVLRAGFVVWLQERLDATGRDYLISGDAEGYWDLAKTIVKGEDYAIHSPPRSVHRMPGLPAVLAISISIFGESRFAARILLATLGALSCGLLYLLGKRIHSSAAGLIAAALLAISPASIGFSGVILSETLFGFTMLLSLLGAVSLIEQLTQSSVSVSKVCGWALLTGILIGLGVYTKPSWILVGPLLGFLLLAFISPRWNSGIAAVLMTLGMVLVLLPWGVRNQNVSGHFKLTTFWMGPSLYDGLNPQATGASDMRFFDDDQLPNEMTEYEVDKEYQRRSWEFAKANPSRVVSLAGAKLWRYWKPWPNAAQFDKALIRIGLCLYTIPVFFLAAWGAWKIWEKNWSIVVCAGPIFYFAGLHMIFVSSLRYRLPAEAPLLVLSAIGILSICGRLNDESKRRAD